MFPIACLVKEEHLWIKRRNTTRQIFALLSCAHFEHDIKSNFFCSLPEDEELGGFQGVAMECDPSYYQ